MSRLAQVNSVLEKFWWGMTVVTLILVIVFCITDGFAQWAFYFTVPILAALMALVRRFMRKRLEKSFAEGEQMNQGKK